MSPARTVLHCLAALALVVAVLITTVRPAEARDGLALQAPVAAAATAWLVHPVTLDRLEHLAELASMPYRGVQIATPVDSLYVTLNVRPSSLTEVNATARLTYSVRF
jgi:hypothetical protein